MGLFEFLEFSFLSSLYILDISPLSELGLVKILSQSVGGLFVLLTVSFALEDLCNFTKFGAKTKGQSLELRQEDPETAPPSVHPIISQQTQTLLHMPSRFCWKDPDIAVSCETMPVLFKYRSGCSQSSIGWNTALPNGGARESTQGAEGVCNPIGGTTRWTNQYPQSSCL